MHLYAEDQPVWVAGGGKPSFALLCSLSRDAHAFPVLLSGVIPMLSVAYMTSPFVTYIHLRVPQFARNSRDMLLRYSKNLSKDAELDVTTMNFIGKPRVARVKVADLVPVKKRFGLANFGRDTEKANEKRKWWMGKAVRLFGVHNTKSNVKEGQVWENVKAAIEKNRKLWKPCRFCKRLGGDRQGKFLSCIQFVVLRKVVPHPIRQAPYSISFHQVHQIIKIFTLCSRYICSYFEFMPKCSLPNPQHAYMNHKLRCKLVYCTSQSR